MNGPETGETEAIRTEVKTREASKTRRAPTEGDT
jgi:hypothetical protein